MKDSTPKKPSQAELIKKLYCLKAPNLEQRLPDEPLNQTQIGLQRVKANQEDIVEEQIQPSNVGRLLPKKPTGPFQLATKSIPEPPIMLPITKALDAKSILSDRLQEQSPVSEQKDNVKPLL